MGDFKNLKEFIDIAKSEGVEELKYETGDEKFFVSFATSQAQPHANYIASHSPSTRTDIISPETSSPASSGQFHEITSPFVGTYYSAPTPGKPNFVKVGDRVSKGQTLCILEAMKIMNEIESDIDGEIVEISASNESLVEYGQVLFKIKA